jgi:hypothetical protein
METKYKNLNKKIQTLKAKQTEPQKKHGTTTPSGRSNPEKTPGSMIWSDSSA